MLIFVNVNQNTPLGKTIEGVNRNIKILGRGQAILDGGLGTENMRSL